ncbi:uncharacterized protein LOC130665203 [Microplitis mediator]|uniref:uncharacterized protein LOC130665203 n=1 Tax=Microplitis mediator TaxID=375433 RepID=UPI002553E314|nr:uncharacterized protein LOC130665203 [Microplitis mediator]
MAFQIICLFVLLTTGLSQGQFFPDFDQFNPMGENSEIPNSETETTTAVNENENTTEGSGNVDNQQDGDNPANMITKAIDAAKETIEENNDAKKDVVQSLADVGKAHLDNAKTVAQSGITIGTSLPRFGAKLMG